MIRTSSVLFWFSLAIAASVALYCTSNHVQGLNQQLRTLNTAIESERQSLHVLKAEWVYLANPARLETASRKYLALRPTSPQQVARLDELAEIVPTRSEAMAAVTVKATPIASVRTSIHTAMAKPTHTADAGRPDHNHIMTVASADTSHINDHMIMQRTASAQPAPDSIGALLNELDSHP